MIEEKKTERQKILERIKKLQIRCNRRKGVKRRSILVARIQALETQLDAHPEQ